MHTPLGLYKNEGGGGRGGGGGGRRRGVNSTHTHTHTQTHLSLVATQEKKEFVYSVDVEVPNDLVVYTDIIICALRKWKILNSNELFHKSYRMQLFVLKIGQTFITQVMGSQS